MAKCSECGAPVNLAPDGDPRYEPLPPLSRKPDAWTLPDEVEDIRQGRYAFMYPHHPSYKVPSRRVDIYFGKEKGNDQ